MLFSFLNNDDEVALKRLLSDNYFVSCSSEVLPETGEYERGIATWLNSCLGPKVADYLQRLKNAVLPSPVAVMMSSAGTMDVEQAKQQPPRPICCKYQP